MPFYFTTSDQYGPVLLGENMLSNTAFLKNAWSVRSFFNVMTSATVNDGWVRNHHISSIDQRGYFLCFLGAEDWIRFVFPMSLIPRRVVEEVIDGRIKLLIWMPYEFFYDDADAVRASFRNFRHFLDVVGIRRENSVVFVHSLSGFEEAIDPVQGDRRFVFIHHDWFEIDFRHDIVLGRTHPSRSHEAKKDKLFLCLNNRPRYHRRALVGTLKRAGMLERGLVSFLDPSPSIGTYFDEDDGDLQSFLASTEIERMVLDRESLPHDRDADASLYDRTFFSVVTETCYAEPYVFLTEKTFKPIINHQPFLIVGPRGTLSHLRNRGYQTFPELFDESYDEMPSTLSKIKFIVAQIERLAAMPHEDVVSLFESVRHKVEHNFNLFMYRDRGSELRDLLSKHLD